MGWKKRAAALLLIFAVLMTAANLLASDPTGWGVGVSVGGFRTHTTNLDILKKIKAAGFDRVEFSLAAEGADWPEERRRENLERFKADCDAAGLDLWSVHMPFSRTLDISLTDDVRRQKMLDTVLWLMDENKTMGAKVFVIHPSSEPIAEADRPARIERCVESLKFLNAEAKKCGIKLSVENLPRTCLMRDAAETNQILAAVGDGVTLVFDSNHLLSCQPEEFLAELSPEIEIATTHFSDYDGVDERHWAPYEGVICWKAVMAELVRCGYGGPFVFEGAGRPAGGQLNYVELFERWVEVRDEYLTGLPPARALWPVREILASTPHWKQIGEPNGLVVPIIYESVPYQKKPTEVFAYLGIPEGEKAAGSLPAILLIHGGGGTAFSEWTDHWARRGYVALAMDLAGCGPDGARLENGGPDQEDRTKFRDFSAEDFSDRWTFQAIAAILKGHALLKSLPEVNAEKIAATGISWGGYLTCILSGIDPQVKTFVPIYGCGFLHENSAWKETFFDAMTPEHRERWVKLFDPSSHLPRAAAPMLWVNGTNDFAYPLDSYVKSYRLPSGSRTLALAVNRPHGHIWTFLEVDAMIDSVLLGTEPLISVGPTSEKENRVTAEVVGGEKPVKAELVWTADAEGPWQKKTWQSAPATVEGAKISAERPKGAACYFLLLTDCRGLTVTTVPAETR